MKSGFYYDPSGGVVNSCHSCKHNDSVKYWLCLKDNPGPRRWCGYNSTCDEWQEKEEPPKRVSRWRRLVNVLVRIIGRRQKSEHRNSV
jgi:hypothetical protein